MKLQAPILLTAACFACSFGATRAAAQDPFPFHMPTRLAVLAELDAAQRDLKATPAQIEAARGLLASVSETKQGEPHGEDSEPGGAGRGERVIDERLEGLLSQSQMQRLSQIAWQLRPDEALQSDEVATALEISDEQATAIESRTKAAENQLVQKLQRMRFKSAGDRNTFVWRQLHKSSDSLLGVLTDSQKKQFERLTGEAFRIDPQ